ncbi:MAG TPA: hypothetical protein VKF81_16345 [Blastocatellia bacterium]|nr:hypothetical protein [Blastocatellia bacterium]
MNMRSAQLTSLILVIALAPPLSGCKAKTATNNSPTLASSNSSNANISANANKSNKPSPPDGGDKSKAANADSSPQLAGTYQAREIRDKQGITTLVSERRSLISFLPDGTYSRVAQRKDGTTDHSDSGRFRIDAPDKLLLTIEVSDKKIQNPPLHRMHRFSLSEDGDELKMTSEKGVAVYRRISKTKSS